MDSKKNILFIINPISGIGKQKIVEELIAAHLDKKKFNVDLKYTERPNHALEIASNALTSYEIIAAVGGDGSVNEVGKSIINSDTILAIIPAGSGNGLARDLRIPMDIKKAIRLINRGNIKLIDTAKFNDDYFLGTAGVGFDSYISWKFSESKKRGFWTYLKIALIGFFKYEHQDYTVNIKQKKHIIEKGILVTFCNSKQYGNNILISPNSKIDDGLIRLIIVKRFPLIYLPIFCFYLLTKQIHKFKYTKEFTSDNITLYNPKKEIHIDGEPLETDRKIEVQVIPKSLKVLVP